MKILIINGPNINMLGIRETNIYGTTTYSDMINLYQKWSKEENIDILTYQSNHEGDLIDNYSINLFIIGLLYSIN